MSRYKRKTLLKPQKNSDVQNWKIKSLQIPYFTLFYDKNTNQYATTHMIIAEWISTQFPRKHHLAKCLLNHGTG